MNRFLAGLVERAEGRAPVLLRRPRSLFEPESPASGASVEPLERDEVRVSTPARREPRDEAPPPPPRTLDEPRRPRGESVAMAPRAEARHHVLVEDREASHAPLPREAPRSARRAAVASRVDEAAEPPRRATPRGVPAASPTATPLPVDVRRPAPTPERPTREASAVEPAGRARRTMETPTPPIPPARRMPTPPVAPAMVSRAQPVVQHPAVVLARSQTAMVARRERAAAPEPAPVQITIGRVEVRAAPAGPEREPRRAGPTPPRLSLEDYLRQRTEGAR